MGAEKQVFLRWNSLYPECESNSGGQQEAFLLPLQTVGSGSIWQGLSGGSLCLPVSSWWDAPLSFASCNGELGFGL